MRNVSVNHERSLQLRELGENKCNNQELMKRARRRFCYANKILPETAHQCSANLQMKNIQVLLKIINQLIDALMTKLAANPEQITNTTPAGEANSTTASEETTPKEVAETAPTGDSETPSGIKESLAFVISAKKGREYTASDLSDTSKVTEHDLYAAAIHNKIKNESPEMLERFEEEFENRLARLKLRSGKTKVRAAANRAIRSMVKSGIFSRAEARELRQDSFGRAQMDSDRSWLSRIRSADGSDSPVRTLTEALELYSSNTSATDSEFNEYRARRVERRRARLLRRMEPSSAQTSTGVSSSVSSSSAPDNFLWKPESESDGNLVILLPQTFTGNVEGVSVYGPDGQQLEEGRASGVANGGREHFRFSKPGGSYPAGTQVVVTLSDGTIQRIEIGDTARREG